MIKFEIKEIINETTQSKSFVLTNLDKEVPPLKSGQFMTFVFQTKRGEERRSYSISSSPELGEPLKITIKRVDNGEFSRYFIDKAKIGDKLYCSSISGFFTLPDNLADYKQIFFLAAGSGISPIYPIIKTILKKHNHIKVNLIYSSKDAQNTIFKNDLDKLMHMYSSHFHIDYLFSASANLLKARLNNFLLADILKEQSQYPFQQTLFYTCGPFEYMDTVMITLLTEGVPKGNIRKENFNTFVPERKKSPKDKNIYKVKIIKKGQSEETIEVQYPASILEVAKKNAIIIPYSCESGQCGSCTARIVEGDVWMAYNEVLTDKELTQGLILTCQAFPIGGNLTIEI